MWRWRIIRRFQSGTEDFLRAVFLQACLCYFRGPRLCWQGTFLLGHYAAMEAADSGTFQSASKTAEQKIAKRWRRKINTPACSLKRIHRRSCAEGPGLHQEPGGTTQTIVFEGSSCPARQQKPNKVDGRVGGRRQSGRLEREKKKQRGNNEAKSPTAFSRVMNVELIYFPCSSADSAQARRNRARTVECRARHWPGVGQTDSSG